MKSSEYEILVPLTSSSGKVRVKRRSIINEYGIPVATKTTPFSQDMYIEWQIGYDAIVAEIAKGNKVTSLANHRFIGDNGKEKALYELSEYVFHLAKSEVIRKQEIQRLLDFANNLEHSDFLETRLKIKRSNFTKIEINSMEFDEAVVEYPLLIHKFDDFDIIVEIITREKQYAVGIMPMLYLCFPIHILRADPNLIGRTSRTKEVAKLIFDRSNYSVLLEVLRLFSMLSKAHNHDVKEILKVIIASL